MGLRIRTNVASLEAQKNLRANNLGLKDEMAKLSSGKRITKSADDAAGLAVANSMKAQNRSLEVARRNANDGISLIQVAEGGLNESSNILTRMRELSIQAASDTVGDREKAYLDKEYQQLLQEMDRIAKSTEFNGIKLLNGEAAGEMEFQVGAFGGEDYKIKWDSSEANATISSLGVSGTGVSQKGDAQDSLELLDEAINKVSSYRATMGALQSRMQTTVNNLDTVITNQEGARSQIEDVDVAESTAKLAAINVNTNASMAVLAQANAIPASAARLIG
jgi:flagellin